MNGNVQRQRWEYAETEVGICRDRGGSALDMSILSAHVRHVHTKCSN
jgi:hypothetical protein